MFVGLFLPLTGLLDFIVQFLPFPCPQLTIPPSPQGADFAGEEWRAHPLPAGGQQGGPERRAAAGARGHRHRPSAAVGRALRGDLRQNQGQCG